MSAGIDITPRAEAIARGLIAPGNAKALRRVAGNYLKLFCGNAIHFWIRGDGHRGFRARDDGAKVVELAADLLDAMANAGDAPEGRAINLTPRLACPADDPAISDAYDKPWRPDDWINPSRAAAPERLRR
jgi:hypothetical protein